MPTTWTPEQKAEALQIYVEHGPGEASRQTGIPVPTIASWARRSGMQTDAPANIARAVEVAKLNREQRKAQLAVDLLGDVERLRGQLWQPHLAYAFGGKDNEFNSHELPEPSPQDKRALAQAASVLANLSQLFAGEATSRQEINVSEVEKVLNDAIPDSDTRRRLALSVLHGGAPSVGGAGTGEASAPRQSETA